MLRRRVRLAFGLMLAALAVGPLTVSSITASADTPAPEGFEKFPDTIQAEVAGKQVELRLTGTAFRKALGIKFYEIGSYCDAAHSPRNVDELANLDAAKQLILVMERDIAESVLRRSFVQAFNTNDPEGKYPQQIEKLLSHMTSGSLKKGDKVTLTHLPGRGVQCQVRDEEPAVVEDPKFVHVVWQVYMGPKGVSADLRTGLGTELDEK